MGDFGRPGAGPPGRRASGHCASHRTLAQNHRALREGATELGWVPGRHTPDEALAAEVFRRLRPGPKEAQASAEQELARFHSDIEQMLAPHDGYKKGLTLTKIHVLLNRRGLSASYSALHRYAHKHFDFGRSRSTVRMAEVSPGEVAEVDFGYLGLVPTESGKRRKLHALIVTLVFSRHQFVYVTHEQTHYALITGLDEAWSFFGGVPRRVVLDNLKAAVIKADRFEPTFQRTFNEYARHRGFIIDSAVVRHPTGKPHVERQVQYVRENFFRGEKWRGRDHVQAEARRWCTDVAGLRVHGTTRRKPFLEFEAHERHELLPFSGEPFDTPAWATPKVHPDHHVRFELALYSVPHAHAGKPTRGRSVTVRGDSRLVRIYLDGALIKTHPRVTAGSRSTDHADYPPEKTDYTMRDPNRIIERARGHGESIGEFAARLLDGEFPWNKLRQAQKLLRLVDRYGPERLEAACRRALAFELIKVGRLESIVRHAIDTESKSDEPAGEVVQLGLRFLRAPESFKHKTQEESQDGSSTVPKDRA